MITLMQTICHLLEEGENMVLATIISHIGSAPRTVGTKMVVRANGNIVGTIGGGLVEAEVLKLAPEVFRTTRAQIKTINLTGASVATTDEMICGGRQEILLEFITANPENINELNRLVAVLQNEPKSFFVKDLGAVGEHSGRVEFCLIQKDKRALGKFSHPPSWLSMLTTMAEGQKSPVLVTIENQRFFVEQSFVPAIVYLFGAGHVSQQVARLAGLVNFKVVVLDDRDEFANPGRFPKLDEIKVLNSFLKAFEGLMIDRDSYVIIVTRGHIHDKTTLEQALRTPAGYIGMIGSRRKRDMIYQALLQEGFSQDDINRVHCPIGLHIGAETPEEIAVSIVAELIKERSERSKK